MGEIVESLCAAIPPGDGETVGQWPPTMCDTLTLVTHSPDETERLGSVVGELAPSGGVVALRGDLASGKTCFVRGMAAGIMSRQTSGRAKPASQNAVSSPTFTLVNQYGDSPRLYHVDLYRLRCVDEQADLGYEDLFEPDGITVIEWAERAEALLPRQRLDILFEHVHEEDSRAPNEIEAARRRITIKNFGLLPAQWTQQIREAIGADGPR